MGKRKNLTDERLIIWRNGRAYGDFRSYEDVGGGREALSEPGKTWGHRGPRDRERSVDARLKELKAKRKGRVGVPQQKSTTLPELTKHHLIMKATANLSDSHLADLQSRLRSAIKFFGSKRDPRTITPDDVRAWGEALSADGTRKPDTVRHYLNALSGGGGAGGGGAGARQTGRSGVMSCWA